MYITSTFHLFMWSVSRKEAYTFRWATLWSSTICFVPDREPIRGTYWIILVYSQRWASILPTQFIVQRERHTIFMRTLPWKPFWAVLSQWKAISCVRWCTAACGKKIENGYMESSDEDASRVEWVVTLMFHLRLVLIKIGGWRTLQMWGVPLEEFWCIMNLGSWKRQCICGIISLELTFHTTAYCEWNLCKEVFVVPLWVRWQFHVLFILA